MDKVDIATAAAAVVFFSFRCWSNKNMKNKDFEREKKICMNKERRMKCFHVVIVVCAPKQDCCMFHHLQEYIVCARIENR